MADTRSEAVRWYASTRNPASKAAVVGLHWESCFGEALGPVLRGALDALQHTGEQHASPTPTPDVAPNEAHHAEAIPSGPNGPYTTYWFSRALTQDEKEEIGRAYLLVEAKLQA